MYVADTVIGHFMVYVLLASPTALPFPVAVIKHSNKSNSNKKDLFISVCRYSLVYILDIFLLVMQCNALLGPHNR